VNRLKRALYKLHKQEGGLTGLETAIVLIAFVTVAAVFGYAVLSAGIFSTEKAKESVYQGMQEAKSTMVVKGNIIASTNLTSDLYSEVGSYNWTAGNYVGEIRVTLANAMGGEPIDLTLPEDSDDSGIIEVGEDGARTVIAYSDLSVHIDSIAWATRWLGHHDGDQVLEKGETVVLLVPVGPALDTKGETLDANQRFSLEIKPPHGATIDVEKWIPASIDTIMDLK
jgi:flagellin FlaB